MPDILGFVKRNNRNRKEVVSMYGNNYPNDFDDNVSNTQGIYSGYQNVPLVPETPKKKKKEHKFMKKLAIAAVAGLFFGSFAGAGYYTMKTAAEAFGFIQSEPAVETQAPVQQNETGGVLKVNENTNTVTTVTTDVTGVVKQAMPSIVAITNMFTEQYNFFGQKMESPNEASGSGIIVGENDTELLVVTNQHVIADADELSVQFIDGEQVKAKVKGYDSEKDLAVIAVPLGDIKDSTKDQIVIASLGDSDGLSVGEPAIAIGNALGYGQSVTTGVISALDRELNGSGNKLIQTDAAINPGNSGGALLNVKGEVIGINSNKIGGTVVEGMGYAIPISSAKPIIDDLMSKATKGEKVAEADKSYLGISGVNVTEEVSQMYGMPRGVYVGQVYEGTAAEKAGIVKGDIITKFDGSSVSSMEELQSTMEYYAAGTEVELTIQQGSPSGYQEKKVTVVLGARADADVD